MTPIYTLYRAKHFKLPHNEKWKTRSALYDVDRETHNFPSLKYYYSNIASTCTRVYIARVTLRLYHTRRTLYIYIYILQVIDDIEVFHMEWNDNSWREATWRFFAIYSIILNSTHEYLIKKALLFEYIQIFNSFVASYSTFKSTTLCRSCARHLLLD